jgi:isopentenyldiphosphate isomerase
MPAQDLTELFDIVDVDGNLTGVAKPRGEVHRDGDWHRSVHLWVVFETEPRTLLLQRRGYEKDTNPGKVDVSVAGHLSAGESPTDALRESREEVGLVVTPEACEFLGVRRSEHLSPHWKDREQQHVFVTFTSVAFESLVPHPEEVASLVRVSLSDLRALITRGAPCPALERDAVSTRAITLTPDALVATTDGYPAWVLDAIERRPRRA